MELVNIQLWSPFVSTCITVDFAYLSDFYEVGEKEVRNLHKNHGEVRVTDFCCSLRAKSIYLLHHVVVTEEPVPSDTPVMLAKSQSHGLLGFLHTPKTITHIESLQALSNAHHCTVTFFATDTQPQVKLTFLSQVSKISHFVNHSCVPYPLFLTSNNSYSCSLAEWTRGILPFL